jgi:hypothetical protein
VLRYSGISDLCCPRQHPTIDSERTKIRAKTPKSAEGRTESATLRAQIRNLISALGVSREFSPSTSSEYSGLVTQLNNLLQRKEHRLEERDKV